MSARPYPLRERETEKVNVGFFRPIGYGNKAMEEVELD